MIKGGFKIIMTKNKREVTLTLKVRFKPFDDGWGSRSLCCIFGLESIIENTQIIEGLHIIELI